MRTEGWKEMKISDVAFYRHAFTKKEALRYYHGWRPSKLLIVWIDKNLLLVVGSIRNVLLCVTIAEFLLISKDS